jgi:hypothetical protein
VFKISRSKGDNPPILMKMFDRSPFPCQTPVRNRLDRDCWLINQHIGELLSKWFCTPLSTFAVEFDDFCGLGSREYRNLQAGELLDIVWDGVLNPFPGI